MVIFGVIGLAAMGTIGGFYTSGMINVNNAQVL